MKTRFGALGAGDENGAPRSSRVVELGSRAGAPSGHAVLCAERVSKSFAGVKALHDVDFDLRQGEVHALMGENGAGKSTLMKILAGVHTSYDGIILVEGHAASFNGVRDAEEAGVAIIHQELNLVPELSVADNIFLGREPLIGGVLIDRRRMVESGRAAAGPPRRNDRARAPGSPACASASSSSSRSPRHCRSMRASSSWTSRPRRCRPRNATRCSRSCASSHAKASRSSTHRIGSRRCWSLPTASPCCATAGAW